MTLRVQEHGVCGRQGSPRSFQQVHFQGVDSELCVSRLILHLVQSHLLFATVDSSDFGFVHAVRDYQTEGGGIDCQVSRVGHTPV